MTWMASIIIFLWFFLGVHPLWAQEFPTDIQGPETRPSPSQKQDAETVLIQTELKKLQSEISQAIPDHSGTLPITFNQVIQVGILNNLRTLLSTEQVSEAKGDRLRSLSGLLPNLHGRAGQMRRTSNLIAEGLDPTVFPGISPGAFGPFNSFDARVYLVQTLFDLEAIGTAQAGRSNVKRSLIKVALTKHLVFEKAGEAYVKVLKSQGDVKDGKANLELAETLLEYTTVAFNAGIATGVDKARAESAQLKATTKLLEAKTELVMAQNELKEILLIPMTTQLNLISPLSAKDDQPPSADQAVKIAQTNRPDILSAKQQIKTAGYQLRAAIGQQTPSLGFGANYGGSGNSPGTNVAGTYQLAAVIQVPIFDGGNTAGLIRATKSKKRQAEIILGSLLQNADKEVRDALAQIKYTSLAILSTRKRVEVTQLEMELTQDRFFAGVGDNLEVVRAQTELADARSEYNQSLAQYNNSRIKLALALGIINDFQFSPRDPPLAGNFSVEER